jgi:carboxypeptidase Taq
MTPYENLENDFRKVALLDEAAAFLSWDSSVHMPDASAPSRAEQLAALRVIAHESLARAEIGDWLDAAEGSNSELDEWQRANLREMRRSFVHATAVPADLVAALVRAASASEMAWREANPAGDFSAALPKAAELLRLVREKAAIKAAALGVSPYDALLDQYEPGGRSAEIDRIFDELERFLPRATDAAITRQATQPALAAPGPFPVERQRVLSETLMRVIGFPFAQGRLDVSLHPFSGGTPDDLRITTRYDENDFAKALMATLHETGHALYEAGLPKAWRRQPVGEARGMVLHESQSLLLEMQCCRSREFLRFAAPILREKLAVDGAAWSAENLYRLATRVERGYIRVDADEVTYPSHVILRYRLERALIAGDLALADLPTAWNEGFKRLFGVTPPNHTLGCLQDIHWYDGAYGYFPTYTLGALAAAQLFAAAEQAVSGLRQDLERGDFTRLYTWLRARVHQRASLLSTRDLLIEATGEPLAARAYKAHIERRYLGH